MSEPTRRFEIENPDPFKVSTERFEALRGFAPTASDFAWWQFYAEDPKGNTQSFECSDHYDAAAYAAEFWATQGEFSNLRLEI